MNSAGAGIASVYPNVSPSILLLLPAAPASGACERFCPGSRVRTFRTDTVTSADWRRGIFQGSGACTVISRSL